MCHWLSRRRPQSVLPILRVSSAQRSKYVEYGTKLVRWGILPTPARFPQTHTEGLFGHEFSPRNCVCFAWYFEHPNGSSIKRENKTQLWFGGRLNFMSDEPGFKEAILHKVSFFCNVESNFEQGFSDLWRNVIPVQPPPQAFLRMGVVIRD